MSDFNSTKPKPGQTKARELRCVMKSDALYNNEDKVSNILYPGKTDQEKVLNKRLLQDYDYEKYVEGLTGYAGQDLQAISRVSSQPAQRTRVGQRGHYKAALTQRADGALVCAPCIAVRGEGPYDVEFFIKVYESVDQGLHWTPISTTELKGKEPSLICCQDGTLVMTAQPIVDGTMGYSMPVYRSTDGGITWTTQFISGNRDYPRNLFVDTDGSLCFMRCKAVRFEFEEIDESHGSAGIEINRSHDNGLTWSQSFGQINDWDYPGYMELSSLRLPSGALIASLRHQPSGTKGEGFENTLLTWSHDDGLTWTTPVVASRTGEVHFNMTLLRSGKLLATYSNYHLPFGICAVTSNDEGHTWDYDNLYQLAISADYYAGWGVTCELKDGSLITSYAITPYLCEPPNTTVCETVKWQL